jgi:hypothetical protein
MSAQQSSSVLRHKSIATSLLGRSYAGGMLNSYGEELTDLGDSKDWVSK